MRIHKFTAVNLCREDSEHQEILNVLESFPGTEIETAKNEMASVPYIIYTGPSLTRRARGIKDIKEMVTLFQNYMASRN